MNRTPRARRVIAAAALALALPLTLAACGDGDDDGKDKKDDRAAASTPAGDGDSPASDGMSADEPFGKACATVPEDGAGSFDGMAEDPVATAASNNPALSTLVTAVKKAGLVDTLNTAKGITVFAPTNDAFAKIPKADLDKVLKDKQQLTKILTYHVVGRKLAPQQLENGSYATLEKSELTTAGSGEQYKVNDSANVVCGNVRTANATVHIIDTVLMPKK
ncbi:fasciclin domain-containing protein [Streptomyces sp. CC224B]|uniref:fasciclin domain-containing protein n=1 Tax=Streptomyces sp. CC224B TaxID=3044571 RepID=UPI0024A7A6EF|nr:fasciclin domain-containing protein [Streptomyces sp. CC224B]